MSDVPQDALYFSFRGMNGALDPALLDARTVARAVNVRLDGQMPRTRYRMRELRVEPEGDDAVEEEWKAGNTQGARHYNPAKGKGGLIFGDDRAKIFEASGGKKYTLAPIGRGPSSFAVLEEESSEETETNADVHLNWLEQAENWMIATDGYSNTWMWDGGTDPRFSKGYNLKSKTESELANGATVTLYIHYRVHQAVNCRQIVVGDGLHRQNLSSSENLVESKEQVHWDTGQWFAPPSSMAPILAAAPLPMQNTQHGEAEAIFHCLDGAFSINTNIADRSKWSEQAIVRHILLKTAATGPYALDLHDGDQIFRSRIGIQTLRSAAAESRLLGNPHAPISDEVGCFMDADWEPDLLFCSLIIWPKARRLLCTVQPMVRGRWRSHRGFVVLNFNPTDSIPTGERSWEGLWVPPAALGEVAQFVNGIFNGQERTFALMWKPGDEAFTGEKKLVEITREEGCDVEQGEDGPVEHRISCALWTRVLRGSDYFKDKEFTDHHLFLRDVKGTLDWGVWWRAAGEGCWRKWAGGCVSVDDGSCSACMEDKGGRDFAISLGSPPDGMATHRHIQIMVRWRGIASVEGVRSYHVREESEDTEPDITHIAGKCLAGKRKCCDYDDYENATNRNGWGSVPVIAN